MSEAPEQKSEEKPLQTIQFSYIKSQHFRVIHVDGAVAGAAPAGLFLSFYSERLPIPQQQVFNVDTEAKKVGPELMDQRVSRPGIVREVEAGVVMSLEIAEAFIDLLQRHVSTLKAQRKDKSDAAE